MNDLSPQEITGKAAPAPPAPDGVPDPATVCPRCARPLIDPAGLGWCPACGYCPALQEPAAAAPAMAPRAPSKLGVAEFFHVVGATPAWLATLLAGVFLAVALSVGGSYSLPEDSRERAVWGLVQFLLGLGIVGAAHVLAYRQVPALEVRARSRGAYSIAGLWRASVARLPEARWPVSLLSWGLSLALCAVLFIGGFGWWLENIRFVEERPKAALQEQLK